MRPLLFVLVSIPCVALPLIACSGGGGDSPANSFTDPLSEDDVARRRDGGPRDAGHRDSAVPQDAGTDAVAHDASVDASDAGPFTVGPHPAFPLLVRGSAGRGVLTAPVIVPIFFPGYDHTADVKAAMKDLGTVGTFWHDAVSEYGVGAYTMGTPVELTEQAPTSISSFGIGTWLSGKLDGTHPEFGTPTDQTMYVIFYPKTTGIQGSCADPAAHGVGYGGYHDALSARNGATVAFGVIAECDTFGPIDNSLDMVTVAGSHEIIEAVTDTSPGEGYASIDTTNGFALDLFLGGNEENGDLCTVNHGFIRPGGGYPYLLQRGWSNKAAAAGDKDPCQPALPDQPFIGAAPIFTDTVRVQGSTGPGIVIPVGQSKTVDVELWSTAPTAPFTVAAKQRRGDTSLSFSFDRNTGVNGDRLKLTITANSASSQGYEDFVVTANLNGEATPIWAGIVTHR